MTTNCCATNSSASFSFGKETLRAFLNEHEPNVARTRKRLVSTEDIRIGVDHVICPAARLLKMTVPERRALHAQKILATDPVLKSVPLAAHKLIQTAKADGWTLDRNALWCPRCVRSLQRETLATVRESRSVRSGAGR